MPSSELCTECQAEASRYCHFCHTYRCWEHLCPHLAELDAGLEGDEFHEEVHEAPRRRLDNSQGSGVGEEASGSEERAGAEGGGSTSFLSYPNIIATLPDQKIRDAIKRYRQVILELEGELACREAGLKHFHPTIPRRRGSGTSNRSSGRSSKSPRVREKGGTLSGAGAGTKSKLSPEQARALKKFMNAVKSGLITREQLALLAQGARKKET